MSDWVTLQNALGLSLRPIDQWPGKPRGDRERSPYSAPFKDTLATLKRELLALQAREIVLQLALREQDFRLDGLPRANAIATHPGIILAFGSRHGPLRLYFDRFTKWDHNLRAVAMHLEHLRLAGLYGVGTDGQQYKGWQALPPPEPDGITDAADITDAWAAAQFLAGQLFTSDLDRSNANKVILTNAGMAQDAYRKAAAKLHPDTGGDHEAFVRLQLAKELLDKHHQR